MVTFNPAPTNSIFTNSTRIFSDLDLSFNMVPVTGDVSIIRGDLAVIRSVENLVLTGYYERPFQPTLGSSARQLLFDNITPLTAMLLQTSITEVINNYEPRASLQSVNVVADPENNGYSATITFWIVNNSSPTVISMFLERLR